MKKCIICGNSFIVNKYNLRQKCCSKKCNRRYFYDTHKKEESRYSQGWYLKNRESEIKKNREYRKQNKELFTWYHNRKRYDGLRNLILEKDNNTCAVCFEKNRLHIHHIDGKSYHLGIPNNDFKNLIVLCPTHHHKLHWWQKKNGKMLKNRRQIISLFSNSPKNFITIK